MSATLFFSAIPQWFTADTLVHGGLATVCVISIEQNLTGTCSAIPTLLWLWLLTQGKRPFALCHARHTMANARAYSVIEGIQARMPSINNSRPGSVNDNYRTYNWITIIVPSAH